MAASIVVVKEITYRGAPEEYSNTYHFDGGPPATQAAWLTFDNNVRAAEKAIYRTGHVVIKRTIGYASDETPAEWARTFDTQCTGAYNGLLTPGDCAVWIRYQTDRRDSRGHPVFLRNYYHPAYHDDPGAVDSVAAGQRAALSIYAAAWVAGFSDGSVTHKRTGPDSLGATAHGVAVYIGRRKLKRRG